jgi:hypothetical protein
MSNSLRPETYDAIIARTQTSNYLFEGEWKAINIHTLENTIKHVENLRTFKFLTGNLPEARLHAARIGTMRAELRQMKVGM